MRWEWERLPLSVVLECNRIVAESMNALAELAARANEPFEATRGLWSMVMTERDRLTLTLVRNAGLDEDSASQLAVRWMRGGSWLPPEVAEWAKTVEHPESVVLAPREMRDGHGELLVVPVGDDDPERLSVVCRRCGFEMASGPASMRPVLLGLFGLRVPDTDGGAA
ncbi:hypothetical protein LX15_001644 [Streptoalloteichus tenebrarius]|uniref:Uncharacterized protein n=1 Tax=Streptoalloteichus tenebrarius (strain ATCC 17920 / DSM 40477 / JCM 4838 / CBS 697.72 / NBRC 16177 / NCIMB 11028 / NRRL B-12390 / A12253. 1 / ISP 5477) TaxID=1933 RepID=A0ABT1HR21_STRSD|nr:hypothetical protein [Streptoalloteichus tenebrarius]MCP2257957.1 hypothetical protein [Streptoalloteichus tenebrarius]BFF01620.1 hypothetical protein GCM10020241_32950 [Streptoalloteichus tenebrarius]